MRRMETILFFGTISPIFSDFQDVTLRRTLLPVKRNDLRRPDEEPTA